MHLSTAPFLLLSRLGSSSVPSFSGGLSLPNRMEPPSRYRLNLSVPAVLLRMGPPCR